MKAAVTAVLRVSYTVKAAEGNLNTEIGVPLAILGFSKAHRHSLGWIALALRILPRAFSYTHTEDILVLEFSTDKPGDIAFLAKRIKPDIGMLTSIGPAHIGQFGSLEAI